ncbi:MAG: response regulator [Candidatus Parabeggiatoa sp.]|nr:response regulator [Candidatus Parabeggiatoa sp.]
MSFSLLIADDSKMSRNKIKKIVSSFISDIDVSEANDGNEALIICRSKNIDLMLLDLNMPEVDGYQVLRTLKTEKRPVPTIVVTANYQRGSIAEVEEIGGTLAFLRKPPTPEMIEQALKNNNFLS